MVNKCISYRLSAHDLIKVYNQVNVYDVCARTLQNC